MPLQKIGSLLTRSALTMMIPLFLSAAPMADAADGPEPRVIVKFRDRVDHRSPVATRALEEVSARLGRTLRPLRTLGTGAVVAEITGTGSTQEAAAELAARPDVEYAEPDALLQPLFTPDDTRYYEQWHYFEPTGGMNLPTAWDTARGSGAKVAVLDTGYRPHPDLLPQILPGYDMVSSTLVGNDGGGRDADATDPGDWSSAGECGSGSGSTRSSWHGTHVAGTVAAVTGNASGVAGVAPGAKIVPVRVLGKCGGYTSDISDGILWAAGVAVPGAPANANPAKVLNLSLGGYGSCSATTQAAIDKARTAGATVVVAAGNSSADAGSFTPASCRGAVTVAATDRRGARAPYSNYGTVVDLAAPGGNMNAGTADGILSLLNSGTSTPGTNTYAFYQGTSMASPHVAGLAALLLGAKPELTPDQVEQALKGTARAFPGTCSGCGTGIANAAAAVASVTGGGRTDGGTLANNVARTGLSGPAGAEIVFTIPVPTTAAKLTVRQSGGTGDADLYLRFGSAPTTTAFDYRPVQPGNEESVTVQPVQGGTWHAMVRGAASFSGVTLTASWEEAVVQPPPTTCATGSSAYNGTLSATGTYAYEPWGNYYYSGRSGTHAGVLSGPSNANFDLFLYKWLNSRWTEVARSAGGTSGERISYSGTAGYYLWKVSSASGGGNYLFCLAKP